MTTTKLLSKIIQLPSAATEPVIQNPRRAGRFPAKVTRINRQQARGENKVQKELEEAEQIYLTFKRLYESSKRDLLLAKQRAGVPVRL